MNELGMTLSWCALQVTVVLLVAALVYLWAARRGARAGSTVAGWGLAVVSGVTLLAFCPFPGLRMTPATTEPVTPSKPGEPARVPTADTPPNPDQEKYAADGASTLAASSRLSLTPSLLPLLRALGGKVDQTIAPAEGRDWHWLRVVVVIVLVAGTGLCLLRMLLGLWAVSRCRRRSRPIADRTLDHVLTSLQAEMGCRRRVAVRETPDIATAATLGWWRPLVLLPADWRTWSELELRAVLAHELAHVCRSDYAAGLVARLSVTLHFYHPLVHWLARRLYLQQELAADAVGARMVGGRGPYLRALAHMALRQEGQPLSWPARAFLPARGTLMRRIRMLRNKERFPERSLPWLARLGMVGLLVVVGLGVAALRGPARAAAPRTPLQDPTNLNANRGLMLVPAPMVGPIPIAVDYGFPVAKESRKAKESREQTLSFWIGFFGHGGANGTSSLNQTKSAEPRTPAYPAFDLSYASPDAIGLVAFRPAAIFSRKGLALYGEMLDQYFAQMFKQFGKPQRLCPKPAEIDEVLAEIKHLFNPDASEGSRNSIAACITVMRSKKPFDWKKSLQAFFPGIEERRAGGKVYYHIPREAAGSLGLVAIRPTSCFFLPDDRTIVFNSEDTIRDWLLKGPEAPPKYVLTDAWKEVEHSLGAVALDTRDQWLTKSVKESDKKEQPELDLFFGTPSRWVVGLDDLDDFRLYGLVRCETTANADRIARAARSLLVKIRVEPPEGGKPDKIPPMLLEFTQHLLDSFRIESKGAEVRWYTQATVKFDELVPKFLEAEYGDDDQRPAKRRQKEAGADKP
jgi:beta-lactamase regulating signal transducer with metallopeptidase domain